MFVVKSRVYILFIVTIDFGIQARVYYGRGVPSQQPERMLVSADFSAESTESL
jgi:hypothetical protein